MKTINKLLARWGYKLTSMDAIAEQSDLAIGYAALEAERNDLREQNKQLKRKLACKTAGEFYWRKQAKRAREVIE